MMKIYEIIIVLSMGIMLGIGIGGELAIKDKPVITHEISKEEFNSIWSIGVME